MINEQKKKYTKRKWLELQKQQRGTNGFNTGTRTMQTEKHPSRNKLSETTRKEIKDYYKGE